MNKTSGKRRSLAESRPSTIPGGRELETHLYNLKFEDSPGEAQQPITMPAANIPKPDNLHTYAHGKPHVGAGRESGGGG